MSAENSDSALSTVLACARHLQRGGQWDLALDLIGDAGDSAAGLTRAEVLVDRHAWRLDPSAEAMDAVHAVERDYPVHAAFLLAQLAYWQAAFGLGGTPIRADVVAAFDALTGETVLFPWPAFYRSVALQYLREDADAAGKGFALALDEAKRANDSFLESYALRHQAEMLPSAERPRAIELLRRSLNLRVALGARPHCAASQAMLADALGDCAEAAQLRQLSADTAAQLGLTWLLATPTGL